MTVDLKKRGAQSMAVLLLLAAVGSVAVAEAQPLNQKLDLSGSRTAVTIGRVNTREGDALSGVSIEDADVILVAATQEAVAQAQAWQADPWNMRLMANVSEFLYVRDGAGDQCNIVGKMYRGDVAQIVGHENGWTQITSGNVTGYVKDEFCVTGQEASQLASAVCETKATVQTGGLRIRREPSEQAEVLTAAAQGQQLTVDTAATPADGWVAVKSGDTTGYVSAQYVEVAVNYGTAITIEEEQAQIAAQKAAQEQAAREQAAKAAAAQKSASRQQNAAVAASYDDVTLLAALIQCEAGSEPYEGKLAVGAVVVNRMRSGRYPGTVQGVIYQSGQFTPAASGKLAQVAASGPSSSCIQAAQEALSGVDNTGGAKFFRRAGSRSGVVIGNHVFY